LASKLKIKCVHRTGFPREKEKEKVSQSNPSLKD
jgi:hypothetical protein